MLTAEGCSRRRQRLWRELPATVPWVLIADPRHVNYFSGFLVDPLSLAAEARSYLWIDRSGETVLVCDNHARHSAADPAHVDREIVVPWYDHQHSAGQRDKALLPALRDLARESRGPGLLEDTAVPLDAASALGWAAAGPSADLAATIRALRRRKEADEIAVLRRSVAAGEAGHRRAREVLTPGMSELDLYREVQSAAVGEAGRISVVYGDFRATRPSRPSAGGAPTLEPLQRGDLFILDYSVVIAGYRADFTATLSVGGDPSEQQARLAKVCRNALAAGEGLLRPGAAASRIFRSVSAAFEEGGFGPLTHHAGHGLGLSHPELPVLTPMSADTLESGDVITLEPGAYCDGVGGVRLERNYLITDTGCETLTHHSLELV